MVKKLNKRGFMRVIEATVAILLILGALLILSQKENFREERDLAEILPPVLDEIAQDSNLRREIIRQEETVLQEIESLVYNRVGNPALNFTVRICDLQDECILTEYPENFQGGIYAAERVISASIEEASFNPKKIKIFLWRIG